MAYAFTKRDDEWVEKFKRQNDKTHCSGFFRMDKSLELKIGTLVRRLIWKTIRHYMTESLVKMQFVTWHSRVDGLYFNRLEKLWTFSSSLMSLFTYFGTPPCESLHSRLGRHTLDVIEEALDEGRRILGIVKALEAAQFRESWNLTAFAREFATYDHRVRAVFGGKHVFQHVFKRLADFFNEEQSDAWVKALGSVVKEVPAEPQMMAGMLGVPNISEDVRALRTNADELIHSAKEAVDEVRTRLIPTLEKSVERVDTTAFASSQKVARAIEDSLEKFDDRSSLLVDDLRGLVDEVRTGKTFDNLANSVKKGFSGGIDTSLIGRAAKSGIAATSTILGTISKLTDVVQTLLPYIMPLVFAWSVHCLSIQITLGMSIVAGLSGLYCLVMCSDLLVRTGLIHKALKAVQEYLASREDGKLPTDGLFDEDDDVAVAQADFDFAEPQHSFTLEDMSSVVGMAAAVGLNTKNLKDGSIATIVHDVSKTTTGLSKLFVIVLKMVSICGVDVNKLMGIETTTSLEVSEFVDLTTTLMSESKAGILTITLSTLNDLKKHHKFGMALHEKFKKEKNDANANTVGRALKILEDVIVATKKKVALPAKSRPQPVAAVLMGPPKQGKSLLTRFLSEWFFNVEVQAIDDENAQKVVREGYHLNPATYTYIKGQDYYYDGIDPRAWTILFDDWLQRKSVVGGDFSPLMDFIAAANTEPWLPRCAFTKEEKVVAPKLVLANTNATKFHDPGIEQPDAAYRRWDFIIYCKLKNAAVEGAGWDVNNYVLTRRRWIPNADSKEPEKGKFVDVGEITIDQLITEILRLRISRAKSAGLVNRDMSKGIKKFLEFHGKQQTMEEIIRRAGLVPSEPQMMRFLDSIEEEEPKVVKYDRESFDSFETVDLGTVEAVARLSTDELKERVESAIPSMDIADMIKQVEAFNSDNEAVAQAQADWLAHFKGEPVAPPAIAAPKQIVRDVYTMFNLWAGVEVSYTTVAICLAKADMMEAIMWSAKKCQSLWDNGLNENPQVLGWVHEVEVRDRALSERLKAMGIAMYSNGVRAIKEQIQWLKDNWVPIALAAAVIVPIGLGVFFGRKKVDEDFAMTQSESHFRFAKQHQVQKARRVIVRQGVELPVAHMGAENLDPIRKLLLVNMWEVRAPQQGGQICPGKLGFVNFVMPNVAHSPFHFLATTQALMDSVNMPEEYRYFEFTNCVNQTEKHKVFFKDIVPLNADREIRDKLIMRINGDRFSRVKSLLHHYVTDREMGQAAYQSGKFFPAALLSSKNGAMWGQDLKVRGRSDRRTKYEVYRDGELQYDVIEVRDPLEYMYTMNKGDCGTLVMSTDGTSGGKVMGAHFSGDAACGFSYRITRDEIARLVGLTIADAPLPGLSEEGIEEILTYARSSAETNSAYDPNVHDDVLTLHARPIASVHTNCNQILFNTGKEPYVPIDFGLADTRPSNYPVARAKYCANVVDSEVRQLEYKDTLTKIADQIAHELKGIEWSKSPRNKTFREAIAGDPGTSFPSMNMTTSPGYPYAAEGKRKLDFVELQPNGDPIRKQDFPRLWEDVVDGITCLYHGTTPMWIHSDSLKVEWRKFSKVGKPRLVSGSPFAKTVVGRMLFGSFMEFMVDTNVENETLLGFDPFTGGTRYATSMLRFGDIKNGSCSDFAGFDTDHTPFLMSLVCRIINTWYGDAPSHQRARETYFKTISESVHIRGSIVERWSGSLPSGEYLTAALNSLINKIIIRFTWWMVNECEDSCLPKFRDYVQFISMGDDHVFVVHPSFAHSFTEESHCRIGGLLGYTITAADKDSDPSPVGKEFSELEIVKRTCRFDKKLQRWLMPLRLSVILAMPLRTKADHPLAVAVANLENALLELSMHPQDVWDEWATKMIDYFDGFYYPISMSRDYYLSKATKTGFFMWFDEEGEICLSNLDNKEGSSPPAIPAKRTHYRQPIDMAETQAGPFLEAPTVTEPDGGTTFFKDNTEGVIATQVDLTRIDPSLKSYAHVPGSETILDFLRKPTRIATGSLTTSDTTKLFEVDPWYSQIVGIKANKLLGVGLMRADIVVRIEINAIRFQAGRYILAFMPSGGQSSNGWQPFYRMHTANLTTITQLPHVEIDVGTQTHASLVIPYTAVRPFLPTKQTISFYGTLFLVPYVALISSATETTAAYSVWANFENIELSAPAIPQSGYSLTPSRQEQNKAGTGPISGIAAKIAKTANIFGEIPLLTAPMMGVSWMADVVKRSATVWGFSKPTILSPPNRLVYDIMPYQATADQSTTAQPLSVSGGNESVIHTGVSTTSADELSIDFIKTKGAYVRRFNWTTSDVADTILASINHRLSDFHVTVGKGEAQAPVCFLGNQFQFWRGGIKLRFKMVKTEFHSGRIMVAYTPAFDGAVPSWTAAESEYLYREIIDVRTCCEFEVSLPFIQPDPWLDGLAVAGVLQVTVIDQLVAPDTVSATIPIVVEVCGCDDLEFAVPSTLIHEPYAPAVAMSGYEICPPIVLGSSTTQSEVSAATTGEKITSLRQMLKITQYLSSSDEYISMSVSNADNFHVVIFPADLAPVFQDTSNSDALIRSYQFADLYTLYSCCYLFSNGGFNVRAIDFNNVTNRTYLVGFSQNGLTNSGYSKASTSVVETDSGRSSTRRTIRLLTSTKTNPVVDVFVPHYNRRVARISHAQFTGHSTRTAATSGGSHPFVSIGIRTAIGGETGQLWWVARPVADDANLSVWLGVPPVVLITTG
jgi:hypothetical protein